MSLQESLITYYSDAHPALLWEQLEQNVTRVGTNSTLVIPLGAYPCQDGWISAGVITPREWDGLAQWIYEVTGNEECSTSCTEVATRNEPLTSTSSQRCLLTSLPGSPPKSYSTRARNGTWSLFRSTMSPIWSRTPRLEASRLWTELDHPEVGRLKYPLGVFNSDDVSPASAAAPLLGQDNQAIYCDELGLEKRNWSFCGPQV